MANILMASLVHQSFPRQDEHLTRQAIGQVCRKWGRAAGFHVHHSTGTAMHTRCAEGRGRIHASSHPGPHRVQLRAITWLLTLGTAALCVLANAVASSADEELAKYRWTLHTKWGVSGAPGSGIGADDDFLHVRPLFREPPRSLDLTAFVVTAVEAIDAKYPRWYMP